jgi:hypothetical protein
MDRVAESKLLEFCAQQKGTFDASAWFAVSVDEKNRLALVAMLLASVPWYGHRQNLLRLAQELNRQAYFDTPALVKSLDFDCSRFVHMLQAKLNHERES